MSLFEDAAGDFAAARVALDRSLESVRNPFSQGAAYQIAEI